MTKLYIRAATLAIVILLVAGVAVWAMRRAEPAGPSAAAAVPADVWTCPMHPDIAEHQPGRCPRCQMTLERRQLPYPSGGANDGTARAGVTLDARRQQLTGVRTARVGRERASHTIRSVGVVRADESRQFEVNLKIDGWVKKLFVDYTGRFVRKDEPLFTIYSPDLRAAQQEYLLAVKARTESRAATLQSALEYSGRMVEAAKQRLLLWEVTSEQIAALEAGGPAQGEATFRSPATGFVVDKQVVEGMRVMPGQMLYRIADLSQVWVEADVYEQDIDAVRVGSPATVTIDAYPGETWKGRVSSIHPLVNEQSRSVKVRLQLPNRGTRLKPGMFTSVEWPTAAAPALVVPTDALVDSGGAPIVFVAQGDGYFEPRAVKAGRRFEGQVEILDGLREGEEVAAAATFFIDAESQMRAAVAGYAAGPDRSAVAAQIELETDPSPPRAGHTRFTATVRDANGVPIADATVQIVCFMPAMPSMNMPAMRAEGALPHVADGAYAGVVDIPMAGRWDVTVTVTRHGEPLASRAIRVVAR